MVNVITLIESKQDAYQYTFDKILMLNIQLLFEKVRWDRR
jgi:hypothetical protein